MTKTLTILGLLIFAVLLGWGIIATAHSIGAAINRHPQSSDRVFTKFQRDQAAAIIANSGYACFNATDLTERRGGGYVVHCDASGTRYIFDIEDRGGLWSVKPR